MRRVVILLLIVLNASLAYGQRRTRVSTQNAQGAGPIRRVDFLNFTYRTSLCSSNDVDLGSTVTVHNGEFKRGSDAEEIYFGVVDNKIIYGDLTGDGQEEAIVHTACGHTRAVARCDGRAYD